MELTLSTLKPILKYIIQNNQRLESEGKRPVAVNIVGHAGLGKSEIIEDLAKELDYNYIKMNLAQLSEMGD